MKNIIDSMKSKHFTGKKGVILGGSGRPAQNAFDSEEFRNQPDVAKHLQNLRVLILEIDSNSNNNFEELKKDEIIDLSVLGDYKCPFCATYGSSSDIIGHIEKCAQEVCKNQNKYAIQAMMTTNAFIPLKNGLEILKKYLQNIVMNPQDTKFHAIRTSNRVFMEKVKPLVCHHEETYVSDILEMVYTIQNPNVEHLSTCMSLLELENKVYPILSRGLKKYLIPDTKSTPADDEKDLEITASDVSNEARRRRDEAMEKNILKSRSNKSDEISNALVIIKIRLPDSSILQGKFYTNETCNELYGFILRNFYNRNVEFVLQASHFGSNQKLIFCNDSSLSNNDINESTCLYLKVISKDQPPIFLNNSSLELLSNVCHFKV